MEKHRLITKEEWEARLREENKSNDFYIEAVYVEEVEGKHCRVYKDTRTGEEFAVEEIKYVYMGFNSEKDGKIDELIATVEKYGKAQARYGVTGRTCHELLAHELSEKLPQYDFEIGYNYHCLVTKKQ